ncbi:MAG: hypothetical protein ACD_39C01916G0005 [uncultured bacterium]|nr:MAG: hypothetical protein ACD_39C01916G0005 [uncultured bacterium]
MPQHFKFLDDFVIRYGGSGDIQWFKREDFNNLIQAPGLLPPLHPAQMALQTEITISSFLTWWELRRVGILQTARFEERKILWVIDILQQYCSELNRGEIKLDTTFYLEREISRYFQRAKDDELFEIPSSFLLQLDRFAGLQKSINGSLAAIIETTTDINNLLPGSRKPLKFTYKPFHKTKLEENSWETTEELWSKLEVIERVALAVAPFKPVLVNLEVLTDSIRSKRAKDFSPMSQFYYELLWTKSLAAILKAQKETILVYKKNEINYDTKVELIFVESEGFKGKSDFATF